MQANLRKQVEIESVGSQALGDSPPGKVGRGTALCVQWSVPVLQGERRPKFRNTQHEMD